MVGVLLDLLLKWSCSGLRSAKIYNGSKSIARIGFLSFTYINFTLKVRIISLYLSYLFPITEKYYKVIQNNTDLHLLRCVKNVIESTENHIHNG